MILLVWWIQGYGAGADMYLIGSWSGVRDIDLSKFALCFGEWVLQGSLRNGGELIADMREGIIKW